MEKTTFVPLLNDIASSRPKIKELTNSFFFLCPNVDDDALFDFHPMGFSHLSFCPCRLLFDFQLDHPSVYISCSLIFSFNFCILSLLDPSDYGGFDISLSILCLQN